MIESGGDIEDLKGQKHRKHSKKECKSKKQKHGNASKSSVTANSKSNTPLSSNPSSASSSSSSLHSHTNTNTDGAESNKSRKVTQFSFLGYSLGGLIGRFAMGLLDMEKFFDPVEQGGQGIEPVYFVTMATPHLGIRKPPQSTSSKIFNYLSSRMLSRTGKNILFCIFCPFGLVNK